LIFVPELFICERYTAPNNFVGCALVAQPGRALSW
jgi:hypothetical protein